MGNVMIKVGDYDILNFIGTKYEFGYRLFDLAVKEEDINYPSFYTIEDVGSLVDIEIYNTSFSSNILVGRLLSAELIETGNVYVGGLSRERYEVALNNEDYRLYRFKGDLEYISGGGVI